MPTIPKQPRTISQLIPEQLPDFIRDDYPMFVAFLKAYYEWLETNGTVVWSGKVLATTLNTITLPATAATYVNAYQNMFIVCLNGPAKGQTHKIKSFDPSTRIVTIVDLYDDKNIPPANTLMEIRDALSPEKLIEYRDIDYTLDRFIDYFRHEFMYLIPGNIRADERNILKHIKDFYQAKGTENSFRFIFRILFNEEVEFYYPKVDLFRTSDARWSVEKVMKITTNDDTFDFLNRQLIGVHSGATAKVESVTQQRAIYKPFQSVERVQCGAYSIFKPTKLQYGVARINNPNKAHKLQIGTSAIRNNTRVAVNQTGVTNIDSALKSVTISTLTVSSVDREFVHDPLTGKPEQVKIVYPIDPPPQSDLGSITDLLEPTSKLRYETSYQILQNLAVAAPGNDYQVGEMITINGGGSLSPATAIITSVFQTYYNGSCPIPPSTFYLEPFYGPDDTVNTDGNPLDDAVCIPGMYFFSDVHSDYTNADLLNPNEILLATNTSVVDNFFVGDEIAIVGGTGTGQRRIIVSYNSATQTATVDVPFSIIPDGTTQYSITHIRGGIKSIKVIDYGLGFTTTPNAIVQTDKGSGAVFAPDLKIVATTTGQWLPGRAGGIGEVPTTTDSFPSSNKIIQDSYYWQDFSYDLRFAETIDKYRDVVKKLLHPAGLKMFGSVLLKSKPKTNFLEILRHTILELDVKKFQMKIKAHENQIYHTMHLNTINPAVLGAKNKDFDAEKFRVFPPDSLWTGTYPPPNQNYWSVWGPGNTQINNYKDRKIEFWVNNPNRRSKIAADSEIKIESNSLSVTKVGPIGPTRAVISQFRFVGFPPFQGFDETYPPPNSSYWSTFGNTQIQNIKNIVLSELIVSPEMRRSNICVDGDVTISIPGTIPRIGEQVEYNFEEGQPEYDPASGDPIYPQTVNNVCPVTAGFYNGVLGSNGTTETIDGTWVNGGVSLDSTHSQIVGATSVPLNLSECTVIVVASTPDVSSNMSLISCIGTPTDNGFSIDLRAGGGMSFRVQNSGKAEVVSYPTNTVKPNDFFMAALRFDHGKLSGNISNSRSITVTYPNYPIIPTFNMIQPTKRNQLGVANIHNTIISQRMQSGASVIWNNGTVKHQTGVTSIHSADVLKTQTGTAYIRTDTWVPQSNTSGWYFGAPSADYKPKPQSASLYAKTMFRTNLYDQEAVSGASVAVGYFNGILAYALFYDRALYDYEVDSIYASVKDYLATARNVNINDTIKKPMLGESRIQRITRQTQTGTWKMIFNQIASGRSRVQQRATALQTGVGNVYATVTRTLTGISSIFMTNFQMQNGLSRIETIPVQTMLGNFRIYGTTRQIQRGVSNLVFNRDQFQSGKSAIRNTNSQSISALSRITIRTPQGTQGVSRFRSKGYQTQFGVTRIQSTGTKITVTSKSRIQVTTIQNMLGKSAIPAITNKTQTGISHINLRTQKTQTGVSLLT